MCNRPPAAAAVLFGGRAPQPPPWYLRTRPSPPSGPIGSATGTAVSAAHFCQVGAGGLWACPAPQGLRHHPHWRRLPGARSPAFLGPTARAPPPGERARSAPAPVALPRLHSDPPGAHLRARSPRGGTIRGRAGGGAGPGRGRGERGQRGAGGAHRPGSSRRRGLSGAVRPSRLRERSPRPSRGPPRFPRRPAEPAREPPGAAWSRHHCRLMRGALPGRAEKPS